MTAEVKGKEVVNIITANSGTLEVKINKDTTPVTNVNVGFPRVKSIFQADRILLRRNMRRIRRDGRKKDRP